MKENDSTIHIEQLYRHACAWDGDLDRDRPVMGIIARLRRAVPDATDAEIEVAVRRAVIDLEQLEDAAWDICASDDDLDDDLDDDDPRAGWLYRLVRYLDGLNEVPANIEPDPAELRALTDEPDQPDPPKPSPSGHARARELRARLLQPRPVTEP
jgi:hypothetical protein